MRFVPALLVVCAGALTATEARAEKWIEDPAEQALAEARAPRDARLYRTVGAGLAAAGLVAVPVGVGMMVAGNEQENATGGSNFAPVGGVVLATGIASLAAAVPLLVIGLSHRAAPVPPPAAVLVVSPSSPAVRVSF
jgi:hypothetical protein